MDTSEAKHRSRPLRHERSDVLHFVTSRTIEERFWLHPLLTAGAEPPNRKAKRVLKSIERLCDRRYARLAKQMNARAGKYSPRWTAEQVRRQCRSLVGDALRRAQENNEVEVYAVIVMSNHIHLVIRTPGCNCASFLRDFKSLIAKSVNRFTERSGPLWARRADVQPILDEEAAIERLVYTVDNPRKAKLVGDPEQWPGLNLCFGLSEVDEIPFEYFDAEEWHKRGRPHDLDPFFRIGKLKLSPLPVAEGTDRETYASDVRAWLAARVQEEQKQATNQGIQATRRDVLGVEAVIRAAFQHRPKNPSRSPRPYCFGNSANRRAQRALMSALITAHEAASTAFLGGDRTVEFPAGTYPPPILSAATVGYHG